MQPVHTVPTSSTTDLTPARLWQAAHTSGFPAALWRMPNQPEQHLMVHFGGTLPRVPADLEELPTGFLLSPFHNPDVAETLLLRADAHYVLLDNSVEEKAFASENPAAATFQKALQPMGSPQPFAPSAPPAAPRPPLSDSRAHYEAAVADAVAAMQRGEFRKVALSRTKTVHLVQVPDVVALFQRLCRAYPTAFVSAVWLPERGQTWVCATPERLVSQDAAGMFRTVSLAGTQSAHDADGRAKRPADTLWSQKEIEEQALVSRYIINCFKKIRLREYDDEGPKTVVAGNLMHLRTDFCVDTRATNFPQLGTVMLRLLHPTSAVGGMPREAALAFLAEHEEHDREFYAGFVGPVKVSGETNLFVHIRCLKLEGQTATLYAGAGLTADSQPAREWTETEMKCQTLLSHIV